MKAAFYFSVLVVFIAIYHSTSFRTFNFEYEKFDYSFFDKRSRLFENCINCYIYLPLVEAMDQVNQTYVTEIVSMILCREFGISQPEICSVAVQQYIPIFLDVLKNTPLSSKELCDIWLDCAPTNNTILNWKISLPNVPKPPIEEPITPKSDAPKIRILHLTDMHIDFNYKPGSVTKCSSAICCQEKSVLDKLRKRKRKGAGFWGTDKKCDIPFHTVENMLQHIAANEVFDLIYWTGDVPSHDVFNQTKKTHLTEYDMIIQLLRKYFPNKPIYSTLGNHEAVPCNMFSTPYIKNTNNDWLYSVIADSWTKIGLPNELRDQIFKTGFYTTKLSGGVRLVALNSNYCPPENLYLYVNGTDPYGQLQWLANLLQESENIGEKVHIIGHIPSRFCLESWSRAYYEIVNRYENTISAQFFAHTHFDHFKIFYDLKNTSRAVNIAYITPSVTTYPYLNPGYRIYTIDGFYNGTSARVLDHETRILNLTDANLTNEPKWQNEYSAKETYGLENLFPQDWSDLIDRALSEPDRKIFNNLFKYQTKLANVKIKCNKKCRTKFLCSFKQARSDAKIPCG